MLYGVLFSCGKYPYPSHDKYHYRPYRSSQIRIDPLYTDLSQYWGEAGKNSRQHCIKQPSMRTPGLIPLFLWYLLFGDHHIRSNCYKHHTYQPEYVYLLFKKDKCKYNGQYCAWFINRHHSVYIAKLECFKITKPWGSGSDSWKHQKYPCLCWHSCDLPLRFNHKYHNPWKNQNYNCPDCSCYVWISFFDTTLCQYWCYTRKKCGSKCI